MIEFFRDILDGPLYIGTTILSIILIMAIIGFLMERKKLEKEVKSKVAVVTNQQKEVVPIPPVTMGPTGTQQTVPITNQPIITPQPVPQVSTITSPNAGQPNPVVNQQANIGVGVPVNQNQSLEVASPVIVFEDPNLKKE